MRLLKRKGQKQLMWPAFDAAELKLLIDALLDECDDDDGVDDGMIFDPFGCTFDPAALQCEGDAKGSCLSEIQIMALKRAMAGPVDSRGHQVYPGFLYDTGIAAPPESFIPGLLTMTDGPVIGRITDTEMDVDDASVKAADAIAAVGDSTWTNLSTFSGNGGKLILYHGVSDPWMSALLRKDDRGERRAGGRRGLEPTVPDPGHGSLWRWREGPRPLRHADVHRRVGRGGQGSGLGRRNRQGVPRAEPAALPAPATRAVRRAW